MIGIPPHLTLFPLPFSCLPCPQQSPPADPCLDVTCPEDQCYIAGICDSSTGLCSDQTPMFNGELCDDGDGDTIDDICDGAGNCAGTLTCGQVGAACSVDADCCGNKCKGGKNKSCK